jgi:hypothetical protein
MLPLLIHKKQAIVSVKASGFIDNLNQFSDEACLTVIMNPIIKVTIII